MTRKRYIVVGTAAIGLAVSAMPTVAQGPRDSAAAFNVTPLRLQLASDEQATRMLVRNESNRAMAVQVRIFGWSQPDGKDQYSPSDDVAVSPSIMKIDPGSTQTFHIVGRQQAAHTGEQRYRVVIDQLPDQSNVPAGMARTLLRMTLPLFVNSDKATPAKLQYNITREALLVENTGGRTARISSLFLSGDEGSRNPVPTNGPRYVMGGTILQIPLPAGVVCENGKVKITGIVDKKKFDATPAQTCA